MATHSSVLAWRIPGTGSLVGCHLWGRTESDTTEVTQQQQQQGGKTNFEMWPPVYFFVFENNFIYLFWTVTGSSLMHGLFSSCIERGLLSIMAVRGHLIVVASVVLEHGL